MAFEKQSRHISGLLVELQEKESALLSQGEELQRYKQELDAFKAQKEGEEKKRREEMTVKDGEDGEQKEEAREERSVEMLGLQPNEEKESSVTFFTTNSLADSESNAQRDAGQPEIVTSDAERPTPFSDNEALRSGEEHPGSVESDHTQSNYDIGETECGPDGATADVAAELLALRQENQLLKQRISGLNMSKTSTPVMDTENEHQEDTVDGALPCLTEPRSPSEPYGITAEERRSPLQNARSCEEEVGDLEREDGRTEEELRAVRQPQIDRLQQQVVIVYYLFISQQLSDTSL